MRSTEQLVPRAHVERLMENLRRFRRNAARLSKPADVNRLLEIFPRVTIEKGFCLDYLLMEADFAVAVPSTIQWAGRSI
jgi:hypothetical protein